MKRPELIRSLGLPGATVLGIAAMLGTGVFVVWGPAIALAGTQLLVAVALAAAIAALNAWSTARLAMVHPEAGGAYAYGRIRLHRSVGVLAGVAFIVGKCASAGAAALAIATYVVPDHVRPVALGVVIVALIIDLRGLRRSVAVSGVLIAIVIAVLVAVIATTPSVGRVPIPLPESGPVSVVAAAALCFFAFAGYARITVLGEEVRDPVRTIPRAMAISLGLIAVLYVGVGWSMLRFSEAGVVLGSDGVLAVAQGDGVLVVGLQLAVILAAGAALLALIAGISRTLFAMARNGDAPRALAAVERALPRQAQFAAAALTAIVVLAGSVTWAIAVSAVTILVYYAIAHLAAMTLPRGLRPPRFVPVVGLIGCLGLIGALTVAGIPGG